MRSWYPPLPKAQERGTHSRGGVDGQRPGHPPRCTAPLKPKPGLNGLPALAVLRQLLKRDDDVWHLRQDLGGIDIYHRVVGRRVA